MHIPDGFLSVPVAAGTGLVSAAAVGLAVKAASRELPEEKVPLMGVMGAFVFAAQMVNFPVAAGTSGHLVGAVLLTSLLGVGPAALVMTSILVVQCLLFQDGGLTALGANVLNMAILPTALAGAVFNLTRGLRARWARVAVLFGVAWLATVAASVAAALELALSGTAPLVQVTVAMAAVHALIGLGEGAITVAVVRVLEGLRPGLGAWSLGLEDEA